nr:MAG TPA: hypothetical protein [Caudoviricetes sp.]
MNDNCICAHLYGTGSRNCRLRAEYIRCNRTEECSAYKNGKCFCVTTLFGVRCPNGEITIVDGGTKRSKAFLRVQKEARTNPAYGKLQYPSTNLITRIGEDAFLTVSYTWLEDFGGEIRCDNPHLGTNKLYISADKLTPENIKRICDFIPRSMMGSAIRDYQDKTVPMFLRQLRSLFPERYAAFQEAYPDYKIKAPDWKGRLAKLSTCNRHAEYKDCHKNTFRFDGDYIVCDCYNSSFAPFRAKRAEIRVKLSDEMEVEITDNGQVTDETVFL